MSVRLVEVRQPQPNDVIATQFVVAGFGSGFEAVVSWRVLDGNGQNLGGGNLSGVGSNGVARDFGERVALTGSPARGEQVLLQVFGDDASGQNPPGSDLNTISVTLFSAMTGWRLHEVRPGDNLTRIASELGEGGTVAGDIFAANRDTVVDPDRIFPGQVLRVPLFA